MQTSMVLNQVRWPQAGDVDDCWVVASLQAVNVTFPWLYLHGVTKFRAAAGNPDDPAHADGGNLVQVMAALKALYPTVAARRHAGVAWQSFAADALAHHPLSVCVDSALLPTRLQFAFKGRHQVCVVVKADLSVLVANPLAPVYSRWKKTTLSELKPAVLGFGLIKSGTSSAYYVSIPADAEARLTICGKPVDDTPFDQADVDAATSDLQAKIDAAQAALDGA